LLLTAHAAQTSRYRLLDVAGQGQYGQVYVGVNRESGELVAIKVLNERHLLTRGFLRELNFLLTLQHPHVVSCQAIDYIPARQQGQMQYRSLVMDYCVGGTLRSLLEQEQSLPLTTALRITLDILSALSYAHHRGIIHCDLKPENILLDLQPTGWHAKVSDFGVARLIEDVTGTGQTGSPAYMAPERFYGQTSPVSDLYAVGILLYEMVVGDRPFHGTPAELIAAHLSRPYTLPENIPFLVRNIITKALDKLPQRRYKTAAEMALAVQLALEVTDAEQQQQSLLFSRSPAAYLLSPPQGHRLASLPRQLLSTESAVYGLIGDQLIAWSAAQGMPAIQQQWPVTQQTTEIFTSQSSCWLRLSLPTPQLLWVQDNIIPVPCPLSMAAHTLAIDASGYWCAETLVHEQQLLLHLHLLHGVRQQTLVWDWHGGEWLGTFLLNRRYGLVVSRYQCPKTEHISTQFDLFQRRGHWLLQTQLPVNLSLITPALQREWQLAAFEDHPQQPLLVLVNFRPWRVQRLGLRFRPRFLCSTPWGYVVAGRRSLNVVTYHGEIVGTAESEQEIHGVGFTGDRQLWLIRSSDQSYVLETWDITTWDIDLIL